MWSGATLRENLELVLFAPFTAEYFCFLEIEIVIHTSIFHGNILNYNTFLLLLLHVTFEC